MEELRKILKPCCSDEPVKWDKWEKIDKNNFTEKVPQKDKKVSDALDDFEKSFAFFKLHKFIQYTQKDYLNNTRENLPNNHAIIIVDYAEKYATTFQNAVQASYFGSELVSIFTARAYVGKQAEYSFAIVSDNTKQSKHEVFASLKYIISQLKSRHSNLSHATIFSDGCGGQFKNRYQFKNLLYSLEDYGVTVELVFFATGHGKSPCDGIGAAVKRNVRYNVLSENFNVRNAHDFVQCANTFVKKIHVYELRQDEIDQHKELLKVRWDEVKVKGIPGTMKFHSFKISDQPGTIKAAITSLDHKSQNFSLIK
jgi:hypothetical protein